MGSIRMLVDANFIVEKDGEENQTARFEYGCYYPAALIERDTTSGYCNVHFSNGTRAMGIDPESFHNIGAPEVTVTLTEDATQ